MEKMKIRKDAIGNIINKEKKIHHVTFSENLVTIHRVESYKKYNILDDDNDDEEENKETNFIDNYTPTKVENFSNNDPHGISKVRCVIL